MRFVHCAISFIFQVLSAGYLFLYNEFGPIVILIKFRLKSVDQLIFNRLNSSCSFDVLLCNLQFRFTMAMMIVINLLHLMHCIQLLLK